MRDQADLDYVQSLVDRNPDYFATFQRPELGDFLYADTNGDGSLDNNDRVEIGKGTLPTFTYGASLGLTWRDFDFSLPPGRRQPSGILQQPGIPLRDSYGTVAYKGDATDSAWTPENPTIQNILYYATAPAARIISPATP